MSPGFWGADRETTTQIIRISGTQVRATRGLTRNMKKIANRLVGTNQTLNLALHIVVPLILCVLICAFQYRELQEGRKQHLDRAQLTAHDLASTVAISIAGSIENIDLTLQAAADQVKQSKRQHNGTVEVHERLRSLQQRVPSLVMLAAADSHGNVEFTSADDATDLHVVSDRAYFQELRDAPSSTMLISPPCRVGCRTAGSSSARGASICQTGSLAASSWPRSSWKAI